MHNENPTFFENLPAFKSYASKVRIKLCANIDEFTFNFANIIKSRLLFLPKAFSAVLS